jgi:hypothetical protein
VSDISRTVRTSRAANGTLVRQTVDESAVVRAMSHAAAVASSVAAARSDLVTDNRSPHAPSLLVNGQGVGVPFQPGQGQHP